MVLKRLFGRPPAIGDAAGLDAFIAGETAFLVQKTTWEYSRARAGVQWQKLFKEAMFKEAIETSSWVNYPLALAMVGEMVVSSLRSAELGSAEAIVETVRASVGRVLASAGVPERLRSSLGPEALTFVRERLNRTLVAPPKAVKDIPLDGHDDFFRRLPMHPDMTRHDAQLLLNTLRVHLCRAHENLMAGLDARAMAGHVAAALHI